MEAQVQPVASAGSLPEQGDNKLLELPAELRVIIYQHVFAALGIEDVSRCKVPPEMPMYLKMVTGDGLCNKLSLLHTSQIVRNEAIPEFYARLDQIDAEAESKCSEAREAKPKTEDLEALLAVEEEKAKSRILKELIPVRTAKMRRVVA